MSQLAERYATALFEVTNKKGNTQEVLETLLALKESLETNKDIHDILSTPLISDNDKVAVLKSAVASGINDELSTFIQLLTKNNRLSEIPTIATAFQTRTLQDLQVVQGTVQSAVELSDSEKTDVTAMIERQLTTRVELTFKVNPQMIGGIEAKVGSYIFEDSIKTHMQKLNDFITRRVQ